MHPESKRVPVRPVLRIALRVLLVAWAGFWAWFALAVSYGGAEAPPPWWIPSGMLALLALLVVLAWKRPMAGGIALVVMGTAAAIYLDHPATQALLAAPAILLGLGCLALRWRERSMLGAASLALAFVLGSCQMTQDPADLPYRTSSILRHANGRMQRAELGQPTEIDVVLCEATVFHPVYLHPDGRLRECKLAADARLGGRLFEEGDVLSLDESGSPVR